jgi:hypothetical protein
VYFGRYHPKGQDQRGGALDGPHTHYTGSRRKVAADLARLERKFRHEILDDEGRAACPHCTAGKVYEPTEDTLADEVHECPMCFGTANRTTKAKRLRIRAERKAGPR